MNRYDLVSEVVMQNAAAATGNGTAFGPFTGGHNTFAAQVTGTFSATITWEATIDGNNWVAIPLTNINSGSAATTATATGLYRCDFSGLTAIRARVSAYTSGAVTVVGRGQA